MIRTPEQAREFLRRVMGPPKRRLEGQEHNNVWLMLQMTEPIKETNNQHSWCAEYNIGGKIYDVHYFPNEEPYIEEYINE
jgi:hypothetical protein